MRSDINNSFTAAPIPTSGYSAIPRQPVGKRVDKGADVGGGRGICRDQAVWYLIDSEYIFGVDLIFIIVMVFCSASYVLNTEMGFESHLFLKVINMRDEGAVSSLMGDGLIKKMEHQDDAPLRLVNGRPVIRNHRTA